VADQRAEKSSMGKRLSPGKPFSIGGSLPTGSHRHAPIKRESARRCILGIWRLGELVHANSAAEVALAQPADAPHNPRWDYVIKRAIDADSNPEHRRQIVQFTAAATSASHPNLVPILDGSSSGPSPYIVMPRLDGQTMQWHLNVNDRKPLPVALWFVRQVSQALATLHDAGWVHGDVKPSNVIIGSHGHVTLIDMGFAARVHTLAGSHFRGTPEFSAPESLAGDLAALPSMDMFSVGRMLWHWLSVTDSVTQHVLEPIATLVEQLVSTEPSERPTAHSVVNQLLRLEIETLGRHIDPENRPVRRSFAA
jgi:serine/threonine protein kinase